MPSKCDQMPPNGPKRKWLLLMDKPKQVWIHPVSLLFYIKFYVLGQPNSIFMCLWFFHADEKGSWRFTWASEFWLQNLKFVSSWTWYPLVGFVRSYLIFYNPILTLWIWRSQIKLFVHESATIAQSIEYLWSSEVVNSEIAGGWLKEFRTQRLCSKALLETGILNIQFVVDDALIVSTTQACVAQHFIFFT